MYQAKIYFQAYLTDYQNGLELYHSTEWEDTLEAKTLPELTAKVLDATNATSLEELDDEQHNGYDFATEYETSYLARSGDSLEGNLYLASDKEVELWRVGKIELWSVDCHILVSQVTQSATKLKEIK